MSQDTTKTLAKEALFQMEFGINMLNAGRVDTANRCIEKVRVALLAIMAGESDNG